MESVVRMCLDAMALQHTEQQAAHNQPEPSATDLKPQAVSPGSCIGQTQANVTEGLSQHCCCHSGPSAALLEDADAMHSQATQPPSEQALHQQAPQQAPRQAPREAPQRAPRAPPQLVMQEPPQHQLHGISIHSCSPSSRQCSDETVHPAVTAPQPSPYSQSGACANKELPPNGQPEPLQLAQAASNRTDAESAQSDILPAVQLPRMTHADLAQLQSHAADFTAKDKRDWLINLKFLRTSMQQTGWPGRIWSEEVLLDMVGRIASNNFGVYSKRQRLAPQEQTANSEPNQSASAAPPATISDQAGPDVNPCPVLEGANAQSIAELLNAAQAHGVPENKLAPQKQPDLHTSQDQSNGLPLHALQTAAASAALPTDSLPWPLLVSPQANTTVVTELDCNCAPENSASTEDKELRSSLQLQPSSTGEKQGSAQAESPSGKRSGRHKQQPEAVAKAAKEDVIGREMYITASFFNHSCEPNCVKHRLPGQHADVAIVTALSNIKASHCCCRDASTCQIHTLLDSFPPVQLCSQQQRTIHAGMSSVTRPTCPRCPSSPNMYW